MGVISEQTLFGAKQSRVCIFYREHLLRGIFLENVDVSTDDAKECVAVARGILGPGASLPLRVDLRRIRSLSSGARDYLSGPEALAIAPAVGIVIGSPLSRAIGNFYLGFNRPGVPTKLFTDFASADKWLESFLPAAVRVA